MTADVLREAATLMRERAEAATPGDKWETNTKPYGHADEATVAINYRPSVFACGYLGAQANAEHVASWHPAVALAVADWLDEAADHLAIGEDDRLCDPCPTALEGLECSVLGQALTVARAYLGDPA